MGTYGVYTPDVWLSKAFVPKVFLASFLLTNILGSILMSLFSFLSFFADVLVVVLVGLDFVVFMGD